MNAPSQSSPALPKLRVRTVDGRSFRFSQSFHIGRGEDCEVRIEDVHVSRKHAAVSFSDGRWRIRDLNSSNGLFVNGERVDTAALGATSAPRALHLAAVELGAGLLVVPPGTTAERLLDGAPCAVAVVPAETGDEDGDEGEDDAEPGVAFAAIGVGLVETPEAGAAARGAELLARRAGARLRVLCAVRPGNAELHRRVEESASAMLSAEPGVPIDIDVDGRDPCDLLVGASSEVDVLVCGSRCYGPHPATIRGGVTRRVTAEAACPVIVMARTPDVRFEELLGD